MPPSYSNDAFTMKVISNELLGKQRPKFAFISVPFLQSTLSWLQNNPNGKENIDHLYEVFGNTIDRATFYLWLRYAITGCEVSLSDLS